MRGRLGLRSERAGLRDSRYVRQAADEADSPQRAHLQMHFASAMVNPRWLRRLVPALKDKQTAALLPLGITVLWKT